MGRPRVGDNLLRGLLSGNLTHYGGPLNPIKPPVQNHTKKFLLENSRAIRAVNGFFILIFLSFTNLFTLSSILCETILNLQNEQKVNNEI